MSLRKFAALPSELQNETVAHYYAILESKRGLLAVKRVADVILALLLLILTVPLMLLIAAAVRLDSPGSVLFCQTRRMRYNESFRIYKFRTMYSDPLHGDPSEITGAGDLRVTSVGRFLRGTRLDELPQLVNVLCGELSFVGPRPEVPRYVARYDAEMLATLLIPAGITSPASLAFANEAELLHTDEKERVYVELLMPQKALMNLKYLQDLSVSEDLKIMARTVARMFGRFG